MTELTHNGPLSIVNYRTDSILSLMYHNSGPVRPNRVLSDQPNTPEASELHARNRKGLRLSNHQHRKWSDDLREFFAEPFYLFFSLKMQHEVA